MSDSLNPDQAASKVVEKFARDLTNAEKALRDRFVNEYVVDFSAQNAATRIGYSADYAYDMARKFMQEPYVLQKIKEAKAESGMLTDTDEHKRRIQEMLYTEAAIGRNKVAALNSLKDLLGLNAPTTQRVEVTNKQPVQFYIPQNNRQ
jgi:phage terminase small subunit